MAARSRDSTAKPPPPLCLGQFAKSEEELVGILHEANQREYKIALELIENFKKLYLMWMEKEPHISPSSPLAPSTPLTPGVCIERAKACAEQAMRAFANDPEQALALIRTANQLLEQVNPE